MSTVLIAHDSNVARMKLRLALAASGHEVVEAVDGAAALSRIAALRPQAVVTNLVLPRLNGLALTRAIRADGWTMPVVVTCIDMPGATRAELQCLGATCREMARMDADAVVEAIEGLLPRTASGSRCA